MRSAWWLACVLAFLGALLGFQLGGGVWIAVGFVAGLAVAEILLTVIASRQPRRTNGVPSLPEIIESVRRLEGASTKTEVPVSSAFAWLLLKIAASKRAWLWMSLVLVINSAGWALNWIPSEKRIEYINMIECWLFDRNCDKVTNSSDSKSTGSHLPGGSP